MSQIMQMEAAIQKNARAYGVDESLVWAVVRRESGFNPAAVSPKGAMGLMQLMPGTAAAVGVTDPFDVDQNIAGGIKYLVSCLKQFNGDIGLALAAYNAGPAECGRNTRAARRLQRRSIMWRRCCRIMSGRCEPGFSI